MERTSRVTASARRRWSRACGVLLLLVAGPYAARAQQGAASAGGATAGRSPFATNAVNGPFTFDGFEFGCAPHTGEGGLLAPATARQAAKPNARIPKQPSMLRNVAALILLCDGELAGVVVWDGAGMGAPALRFDGLNVNDPNLLSRALITTAFNRLFNNPFIGYITQGVSNQVRVPAGRVLLRGSKSGHGKLQTSACCAPQARRPTDFLPWFLRNTVQRDVTQLRGYDVLDRYFAQVTVSRLARLVA